MTNDLDAITVAGEPVKPLIDVFMGMERDQPDGPTGMTHVSGEFPNDIFLPFARALMRTEAELMLADADALDGSGEERTYEQRCADAMVLLIQRVGEAVCGAA